MISWAWGNPCCSDEPQCFVDGSVSEMFAVVLEVTSSVFNDGYGISALIDENVIAMGFESYTFAS